MGGWNNNKKKLYGCEDFVHITQRVTVVFTFNELDLTKCIYN